ncbi:ATP-dependent helicase, partial [Microvirga sp. 3-52]|nr:ATP-dependent helicase [Microvirga sp. 3-52]
VTLSTFHSSKGLEFRRVFMIDLIKGIIPSEDDEGSDATLEEARRLFYVGMTRAKERLELLTYRQDNGKAEEDSRFLYEVRRLLVKPKELNGVTKSTPASKKPNFKVQINPNGIQTSKGLAIGMKVKHRVFGHGEIKGLQDQEIAIQFEKMERRFDLETILSLGLLEEVDL